MCAHALLPWHAHSIHTLCAETRDTPTYAYAHALLARIHVRTCSLTVARAWYTYIVRRDSRHIRICVRTCHARARPCTHAVTYTLIVYRHHAHRLETRSRVHMFMRLHTCICACSDILLPFTHVCTPMHSYTCTVRGDWTHTHTCQLHNVM